MHRGSVANAALLNSLSVAPANFFIVTPVRPSIVQPRLEYAAAAVAAAAMLLLLPFLLLQYLLLQ